MAVYDFSLLPPPPRRVLVGSSLLDKKGEEAHLVSQFVELCLSWEVADRMRTQRALRVGMMTTVRKVNSNLPYRCIV